MNTNNTPCSAEGPPATTTTPNVRGHAAADTAAPSPSTVHAPSSTNTNTDYNNSPAANGATQDDKVKPTAVESSPANANEGKAGGLSETLASLPQPILPKPPRPFNVADCLEPPRPFNVAKFDKAEDSKLKNEAKQAIAAASDAAAFSLPQPQPNRLEPPRPFNVAKFDEGEDAELKNKAKQVGASKSKDSSIIVPTEEDMADGVALDPATCCERRIRDNERMGSDLELGGKELLQSKEEEESEEVSQGAVAPFKSELPVLEAYIVEEESERDVVIATHLEPSLPWWKQRRIKRFLSAMFAVFAVMAIALGVSMSYSSSGGEPTVIMVEKTSAPSKSLVPTSLPSVSLRPSVYPSLSPTTTSSPTFEHLESLKLVADDGIFQEGFGYSVDMHGDTLVVVAYADDDKGRESGSVFIYQQDFETNEWILKQKLVADDSTEGDYSGVRSVAIYGTTLVVGAPGDTVKGEDSGSAYIYNRDPLTKEWMLQQKLVADDGAEGDLFGDSLAIYGDTVVVGAWGDNDKGEDSGSAYIYYQDPETNEWILQQKFVPDDGAADDGFGVSVAIYEGIVVVGADGDDDKGYWSGSAYIYNRDPLTKEWMLQQKLVAEDGAADDMFGSSVDVYNGTVVVGAWGDNDKGEDSGSAYIYLQDLETNEWMLQQKLVADDGAARDNFGISVAVFADTLVVGAHWDDTDKGEDSGSAYIYYQDPETREWILQQKLVAEDGAASDEFGGSVAIYNGTVFVGVWGGNDKVENIGSVYVYT